MKQPFRHKWIVIAAAALSLSLLAAALAGACAVFGGKLSCGGIELCGVRDRAAAEFQHIACHSNAPPSL